MKSFKIHSALSLLLLILTFTLGARAQVTIGFETKPREGALLDLRQNDNVGSNSSKGLGMPRVKLTTINNIEADILGATATEKEDYIGLVVYNVNTDLCINLLPGLYVWNGDKWQELGTSQFPSEVGTLVDDRDPTNPISYRIGKFGNAGWWMLENIRATTWSKTTSEKPNIQALQEQIAPNTSASYTIPRYRYPGNNPNILEAGNHPEYGLLYNWSAATGDRDPEQILTTNENDFPYPPEGPPNQPLIQGICPEGWHLPSNKEFAQLHSVINSKPCLYGTKTSTGYAGYNMRSTAPVNGTTTMESYSRSYDEGGFNALLVGSVEEDIAVDYGTKVSFWTSSVGSKTNGFARTLTGTSLAITNSNLIRHRLFSVRCKKIDTP